MTGWRDDAGAEVLTRLGVARYDLPTLDKIPLIRELLAPAGEGLSLDIGIGTGYTTYSIFRDRPTVCVDLHAPNLRDFRDRVASVPGARRPLCVVAEAAALPFRSAMFRHVLMSEVLEHLEDDAGAVRELTRVLTKDGRVVVTVPYTGLGFTSFLSFLELCRIKTVHDFPGPEQHVRAGYDEGSLGRLAARHDLEIERHAYYVRFFTRVAVDAVSLGHLCYQRLVHGRRSWTWSDAAAAEGSPVFRLYTWLFGGLAAVSRLDRLIRGRRGFGLVAVLRKVDGAERRAAPGIPAEAGDAAGDLALGEAMGIRLPVEDRQ